MQILPIVAGIAIAVAAIANANATAEYSVTPKTAHPYLFASPDDLKALQQSLWPIVPDGGTIRLVFTPAKKRTDGTDANSALIFGAQTDKVNHFVVRYSDTETADEVRLVLRFGLGDKSYWYQEVLLPANEQATIVVRHDPVNKKIFVNVNETAYVVANAEWQPSAQRFHLMGRKDQKTQELVVLDKDGVKVWDGSNLDWDAAGSRYGFLENYAPNVVETVNNCPQVGIRPTQLTDKCNVATAGRGIITETAKELALAYKLTGETRYRDAARAYANWILRMRDYGGTGLPEYPGTGLGTNNEWTMSARIGALGVLYDWFYEDWKSDTVFLGSIRKFIVDTVRTDTGGFDLARAICGSGEFTASGPLDCIGTPDIDRFYITGHHASAMTGTAIGLLAIVNESEDSVRPLINTIYSHLIKGLLPAREYISQDGGHQTLFFYNANAGEVMERLVMWRRAVQSVHPSLQTGFAPKLLYPYIYGVRKGLTYPALSDNEDLYAWSDTVGSMALAGAGLGNGYATAFYDDVITGWRKRASPSGIWDALYFPGARAERKDWRSLDLDAYMRVSGNVFMRDSWDFDDATLFEFKSSSFSSENHHHLDQNSFSLFYDAPLLVDSGVYDKYDSDHWKNYYRRTIAHNSIVVYDPAETFGTTAGASNDGGQWYRGDTYPKLADIMPASATKPAGQNWLDGIDRFGRSARYAYARGNASKAYKGTKLDITDGFTRSVLYVRPANAGDGAKPVILVYDRVHSKHPTVANKGLPATSLLHSATEPEVDGGLQPISGSPGRYAVPGTRNVPLVIRNGGGMVTVEPLLPVRPSIKVVGGAPGEGTLCKQSSGPDSDDCRFLVRRVKDGKTEWVNYAPLATSHKQQSDYGAWRVEISEVDDNVSTTSQYQYFLNVLRVAKNAGAGAPAANVSVLRPSSDYSAHAVELDSATTVVFGTSFRDTTVYRWAGSALQQGNVIIAAGAVPGASYTSSFNTSTQEWVLTKDAVFNSNNLQSSPAGVIEGTLKR